MATMTSKLPTNERPIIRSREIAAEVEKMLAPLHGKALERAQAAVRRVATSGRQGTFAVIVEAYRAEIAAAAAKET